MFLLCVYVTERNVLLCTVQVVNFTYLNIPVLHILADREVQRILLELLNQMDGFDQTVNVKVCKLIFYEL